MDTQLKATLRTTQGLVRQHWLVALCVAAFAAAVWFGAPVWAAPVTQGGTVPKPTSTPEGGPLATATPRPDDDDDNNSGGGGGGGGGGGENGSGVEPFDPNNPNIVFPSQPGEGAAQAALTALVTVNGLNVREGPGTNFNTLGNLPANTQVTVLSRSEDGAWWYICCLPNSETRGWASAQLLSPNFDASRANELLPVFGSPAAVATPAPQADTATLPQAELPLSVGFAIEPYFVWQGITATLVITLNNPNTVDAVNVLLSDELPSALTLVEASTDGGGTVETVTTVSGNPLVLFRWATVPADTAVTATLVVLVDSNIADGEVIDNLVAVRARNAPYASSAVTIGMPPIVPPDFQ